MDFRIVRYPVFHRVLGGDALRQDFGDPVLMLLAGSRVLDLLEVDFPSFFAGGGIDFLERLARVAGLLLELEREGAGGQLRPCAVEHLLRMQHGERRIGTELVRDRG